MKQDKKTKSFTKIFELSINNKYWFSLVWFILAMIISVFLILIISYFTFIIFDRIWEIENETIAFDNIYEITKQINDYKNIYNTWWILINSNTKSDVFLMKNQLQTEWILFWPINIYTYKLDIDNEINNPKTFWFRKISSIEMTEVDSDSNVVFNYVFSKDNMFSDLKIQDLYINSYNSWSIFDLILVVDKKYNYSNIWKNWSELDRSDLYKYNINF